MYDFNFNLPSCSPDMMREMICATCGRPFIWYMLSMSTECVVGAEQPTLCPYCGGKEVRVRYTESL